MDVKVSLGGLIVGILIGLTGMGGGSVMTPIMIFLFHMHPAVAVGTDLVYASVTKVVGAIQHIRQKTVDFAALKFLSIGSVPGAIFGSALVGYMELHLPIQHVNTIIGQMLGAVYILLVIAMIWRWWAIKTDRQLKVAPTRLPKGKLVVLGLVAGCVVGLTSVGSGALYIAVLGLIYPIASAKMVGTDITQAVLVTGVAGIAHLAFGNVNLLMVASLLLGSIPGILIGSRLTVRIPESAVRLCMMMMLCWSGWNLLAK